jgi:hypothetical protein
MANPFKLRVFFLHLRLVGSLTEHLFVAAQCHQRGFPTTQKTRCTSTERLPTLQYRDS